MPAAIRTGFDRGGERSAAIELRRLFPGITTTKRRENAPGPSRAGRRCHSVGLL
jgi:hypothetical protein